VAARAGAARRLPGSTTPGLADVPRGRELQGYGRLTENLIFIAYEGDGAGREDVRGMGAAFEAAASLQFLL
jgi:hypothetical protein